MSASPKCSTCPALLTPYEAEEATTDGSYQCDACWHREMVKAVNSRPPAHRRFLHDVTCDACKRDFLVDEHALSPESCPYCGFLDVAKPPPVRTARLLKAAHAHLTSTHDTLSTLRRERAAGK